MGEPSLRQKQAGLAARQVATTLLKRVVDDHRNLDALTDSEHGLAACLALPPRDRSLARAIVLTALRRRNHLTAVLNQLSDRPPPKRARTLQHALHVAAAQILFMQVPDSAAVNLAVTAINLDKSSKRFAGFANAVLRRMAREKDALLAGKMVAGPVFPAWFAKRLRTDFGRDAASAIATQFLEPDPAIDITARADHERTAKMLDAILLPNGSIRLTSGEAVPSLPGYETGDWWVQDAAASLPARLIKAEPGARILDLCAAPGGKTAQLAAHGYKVTALDISKPRLERLRTNLKRLGLEADTVCADIFEWQPASDALFDAVLLDAPCSSSGTLRRHPDVVWAKSEADVKDLAALQRRLLERAATFVKPGGCLVFSNCSLFKEEGENLLAGLDEEGTGLLPDPVLPEEITGFEFAVNGQGAVRTLPHHLQLDVPGAGGLDGFFACRFVRTQGKQ